MILNDLEEVLRSRSSANPETSYTAALLADGFLRQRKIMEESFEFCHELDQVPINTTLVAEEAADVLYHLIVGLIGAGVTLESVMAVLDERRS